MQSRTGRENRSRDDVGASSARRTGTDVGPTRRWRKMVLRRGSVGGPGQVAGVGVAKDSTQPSQDARASEPATLRAVVDLLPILVTATGGPEPRVVATRAADQARGDRLVVAPTGAPAAVVLNPVGLPRRAIGTSPDAPATGDSS